MRSPAWPSRGCTTTRVHSAGPSVSNPTAPDPRPSKVFLDLESLWSVRMDKKIVLATRYSDPKQRPESLRAQELKCRQQLDQLGIDHADAVVLRGAAERGDRDDRADFEQLM